MRHSEMRLTNKTHTDVAHLPMAEAAEKLPQFATEKWTQILTQAISTAGRKLSLPVVDGFGKTKQETPDNTEVFQGLSFTVAQGHSLEMVHPSGVEPETC